jgi:hypothetical protein
MMDAVSGIRPQSFKLRLRRPAIKGGLSGVDWFVFMTILLTITSSAYWKNDIGPQVLIALALLCSAYVAYGMQYHGIVLRNYLLLAWSVLGVCYLGLSGCAGYREPPSCLSRKTFFGWVISHVLSTRRPPLFTFCSQRQEKLGS